MSDWFRPDNSIAAEAEPNLSAEALVEKLDPGGALQFIHQFETGRGDYTKERATILKSVSLKKLRTELLPKK